MSTNHKPYPGAGGLVRFPALVTGLWALHPHPDDVLPSTLKVRLPFINSRKTRSGDWKKPTQG